MRIHILREPELMNWGDYGGMLVSGMTSHQPRKNGLLQLERTGPFVPPISLTPFDVVVTDAFKQLLEESGLTGFSFQPVIKSHIVHLEWEKWDLTADDPQEYPESGEPEDYVLAQPHSTEVAELMGDVWEVCLEEHADVNRVQMDPAESGYIQWPIPTTDTTISVVLSSWDGTDLFKATTVGWTYVSSRAKEWLEGAATRWVRFEEAPTM